MILGALQRDPGKEAPPVFIACGPLHQETLILKQGIHVYDIEVFHCALLSSDPFMLFSLSRSLPDGSAWVLESFPTTLEQAKVGGLVLI